MWNLSKIPPYHKRDVIVRTEDGTIFMGRFYPETGWHLYFSDTGLRFDNSKGRRVTHWIDLSFLPNITD